MKQFFLEFSTWISVGATALSLWFIARFIKKHDEFKDDVKKDIDDTTSAFKESVKKIEGIADDFKKEANSLKQSNLDFQVKFLNELHSLKRESVEIGGILNKTNQKAEELAEKFDKIFEHVNKLQNMVDAHHKSLSLGAKAFHNGREQVHEMKVKLDQHTEDFKTVKKVISDTLMLIKKKSEPSE